MVYYFLPPFAFTSFFSVCVFICVVCSSLFGVALEVISSQQFTIECRGSKDLDEHRRSSGKSTIESNQQSRRLQQELSVG